jgi:poly(hydroxyalkanoate) granule-associated protein
MSGSSKEGSVNKPKLKSKSAPAKDASTSAPTAARAAGKTIVESAQHIWLAGLGAFAKAQDEGTRLFEALVREGVALEQKTRKLTAGKADDARSAVESAVGQVRERSQETWDKLEKVFESRVSRALNRLGVPGSQELKALTSRVEELAREVHKLNAKPAKGPARGGATRSVARVKDELADVARELESAQLDKASRRPVAKKPAVKKAVAKKAKR